MKPSIASVLAVAVSAVPAVVWAASPTSDVEGIAFDRIIQIWLENTNFDVSLPRKASIPSSRLSAGVTSSGKWPQLTSSCRLQPVIRIFSG